MFFNLKLFTPQRYIDRQATYYTNPYYLKWTASNISDEYLPKGFIRPKTYESIKNYNLKRYEGNIYKVIENQDGSYKFQPHLTIVQAIGNTLFIIGVIAIIAVIIIKFPSAKGLSKP